MTDESRLETTLFLLALIALLLAACAPANTPTPPTTLAEATTTARAISTPRTARQMGERVAYGKVIAKTKKASSSFTSRAITRKSTSR